MVSAFGCTSRVRTECRYVLDLPEFAANTRLARDCSQENLIKVGEREEGKKGGEWREVSGGERGR